MKGGGGEGESSQHTYSRAEQLGWVHARSKGGNEMDDDKGLVIAGFQYGKTRSKQSIKNLGKEESGSEEKKTVHKVADGG